MLLGRRYLFMKRSLLFLLLGLFVPALCGQSTVFIVRHAEKAKSEGNDPELSEAGRVRAEALAKMLSNSEITTIYATEFKRTQETATPLAKAFGVNVSIVPSKNTAELASKLRNQNGNALVVGHGNTIPDLIKTLGINTPINIAEGDYDNLFIVVLDEKPRFIRLHYP